MWCTPGPFVFILFHSDGNLLYANLPRNAMSANERILRGWSCHGLSGLSAKSPAWSLGLWANLECIELSLVSLVSLGALIFP